MKPLLTSLFILLAVGVHGQITTNTPHYDANDMNHGMITKFPDSLSASKEYYQSRYKPQYDTVPMILFCADTSRLEHIGLVLDTNTNIIKDTSYFKERTLSDVFCMRGYEVFEWIEQKYVPTDPTAPVSQVRVEAAHWKFKGYLDPDRKPLTLFVGMAFKTK